MKDKSNVWIMLVVALVLGGGTFFLTQTYLKNKEDELKNSFAPVVSDTATVIVAIGNINKGDILKGPMVAPVEFPAAFVSNGALNSGTISNYLGKIVNIPMKRGQIVYGSYMGGDTIDRFSDLLKDGFTAVTLAVDAKKSNSHMLIPGDFVDILVLALKSKIEAPSLFDVVNKKPALKKKILIPLLAKIKVLSVDRNPLVAVDEEYRIPVDENGSIPTYSNITVGVPINDATKLALAQDLGEIVFFLRNAADNKVVKVDTLDGLFGNSNDNMAKGAYEYYSSGAKGLMKPISKKLIESNSSSRPPALILEDKTPIIEKMIKELPPISEVKAED